jgi:hypothetical protein
MNYKTYSIYIKKIRQKINVKKYEMMFNKIFTNENRTNFRILSVSFKETICSVVRGLLIIYRGSSSSYRIGQKH